MVTTCSVTSDDQLDIMTTLGFQYVTNLLETTIITYIFIYIINEGKVAKSISIFFFSFIFYISNFEYWNSSPSYQHANAYLSNDTTKTAEGPLILEKNKKK